MSRSERFIPPTREEIQRREEAEAQKREFESQRKTLIERTLRKRRKDDLVDILSKLCVANVKARWMVESALDLRKPVDLILHDLRQAIELATKVDERRMNYNFPVDWDAYEVVKRLMKMLVSLDALDEAMDISIHFMEKASHQVECSDEGLMTEEIEEFLQPVLLAVENCDPSIRASWAFRMRVADRVGFICEEKLSSWSGAGR